MTEAQPTPNTQARPGFAARVREYFLLEGRRRRSFHTSFGARASARERFEAAERRLAGARSLREGGMNTAAITLYREGALLLARARLEAEASGSEDDRGGPPENVLFERLLARLEQDDAVLAGRAKKVAAYLSPGEPLAVDRLPCRVRTELAEELDAFTRALADAIEPLPPKKLVALRNGRIAMAFFGLLIIPIVWAIWRLNPTNIALNRSVKASSQETGTNASGIVDGHLYGDLAFRSQVEASPWIEIDLGRNYVVTNVEVYGPHNCCFGDSVPLVLEASEDGKAYKEIGRRTEAFKSLTPWFIDSIGATVRFIRLRTDKRGALVLTEVVVFGRRP